MIAATAILAAVGAASASDPPRKPLVPYPHPLITEVLYAVPGKDAGDANQDGVRDAAGDEFVELTNPHDRTIQLAGYILTDRNPEDKGKLRFRFPRFELPPGGVVVVFNGYKQTFIGPVGDFVMAPPAADVRFHDAFIFTMKVGSPLTSFANDGDYVLLSAPDGTPLHCIKWGKFDETIPEGAALVEEAPIVIGRSVTRLTADGKLESHPKDSGWFSPGLFPLPIAKK
jgi:hypothetical protein